MTLEDVAKRKPESSAEQAAAEELVRRARQQGLSLTSPDGLLRQLTKTVLETALDQELTEHLGHEKNGTVVNEAGNVRNGTRPKTVLTEGNGHVQVDVPRDRDGTFCRSADAGGHGGAVPRDLRGAWRRTKAKGTPTPRATPKVRCSATPPAREPRSNAAAAAVAAVVAATAKKARAPVPVDPARARSVSGPRVAPRRAAAISAPTPVRRRPRASRMTPVAATLGRARPAELAAAMKAARGRPARERRNRAKGRAAAAS